MNKNKVQIIQTPIELENGITIHFPKETVALSQEALDRLTGSIMTLQEIKFDTPNKAFEKNNSTLDMVMNDD